MVYIVSIDFIDSKIVKLLFDMWQIALFVFKFLLLYPALSTKRLQEQYMANAFTY